MTTGQSGSVLSVLGSDYEAKDTFVRGPNHLSDPLMLKVSGPVRDSRPWYMRAERSFTFISKEPR